MGCCQLELETSTGAGLVFALIDGGGSFHPKVESCIH